MAYTKTVWTNDTAPAINDTNLNKIENGIAANDTAIGDISDLDTTATDLVSAVNEVKSSVPAIRGAYNNETQQAYSCAYSNANFALSNYVFNSMICSSAVSTNNSAGVPVPDFNVNITTKGGDIIVKVHIPINTDTKTGQVWLKLDNVTAPSPIAYVASSSYIDRGNISGIQRLTNVSPGSHTIQVWVASQETNTTQVSRYCNMTLEAWEV